MRWTGTRILNPGLFAALSVGLVLAGLLVGYEPVGGDPDRMYRPIKAELARALRHGHLPFWSERLGLGVPLVAESHVAAFYPPNWLLYGALDVSTAYRLAMWLHHVGLALATYAYARQVGITPGGGALASVSFSLCGFMTIHSSHEWAYHTLAYLPLCLLAADRYALTGKVVWLAALALLWGVQITLGHFQIQAWTAVLTLLTGIWRVVADHQPLERILGLCLAVAWGLAVAAVQLVPSAELASVVAQTRRSYTELAHYSYPPAHWAELAVPGLFRGLRGGPEGPYWDTQETTAYEACFFVGTVPLILAAVGLVGGGRGLTPWRVIVPISLALATMPRWWPHGYALVLHLPVLGGFRCPARYTALSSLGLALLAGRGLDTVISTKQFRAGFLLAVAFGVTAFAWAVASPIILPRFRACLDDSGLVSRIAIAALAWTISLGAVGLWRRGLLRAWPLIVLTVAELAAYYHLGGTTRWGWSIPLPAASPVLTALLREPGVRRVGGVLDNLPLRAGLATATPYTGFRTLPSHLPLLAAQDRTMRPDEGAWRWLRRLGVTNLVVDDSSADLAGKVVMRAPDTALDRLTRRSPGLPEGRVWRVVRIRSPFPEARVALHSRIARDRLSMLTALSLADDDDACYLPGAAPPERRTPPAQSAQVLTWDGRLAEVEHDGSCDLILLKAHYPGWWVRVNDGPERPALSADVGLIAVRIEGTGVSRVVLRYSPSGFGLAALVSTAAVLTAVGFILRWQT